MPEGHTIHHLAGKLSRAFAGDTVVLSSPQGRFSDGARDLDGRVLTGAEAKGKHAFVHFEGDRTLHVHLGLYGRTRFHKCPPPEPRGAVRVRIVGPRRAFDLVGPTCCEVLDPSGVRQIFRRLGPDPLRKESRLNQFRERLTRSRRAVGAMLLDQSVVSGVGNVYRSELLFLAGIHPKTPANTLQDDAVKDLWRNIVHLLRIGKKHNQIRVLGEAGVIGPRGAASVNPADWSISGRFGPRQDRVWVYKRTHCKVCETPITQSTLASRTAYHCPTCQPAP